MAITLRLSDNTPVGKVTELSYNEMNDNLRSFYYSSSFQNNTLVLHTTGSVSHSISLAAFLDDTNTNIYNTDGALAGNRIVTLDENDLIFVADQGETFTIATDPTGVVAITDLPATVVSSTVGIDPSTGQLSAMSTGSMNYYSSASVNLNTLTLHRGNGGTSVVTINTGSGAGGGITVDNNVNNYMLTATGGSTINGEANATFTPASGFGSQHWLDIKNGGLSLDSGLISYGYLSSSALPHSQDTTIMTISPATYAAIFIDYQIAAFGSTAQRSGAFMAHWNSAGTVSFANYSTVDVGAISEANTLLRAVYQSPNIEIYWNDPSIIVNNNHGYVATYRLLKRMTIVDLVGGGGGLGE